MFSVSFLQTAQYSVSDVMAEVRRIHGRRMLASVEIRSEFLEVFAANAVVDTGAGKLYANMLKSQYSVKDDFYFLWVLEACLDSNGRTYEHLLGSSVQREMLWFEMWNVLFSVDNVKFSSSSDALLLLFAYVADVVFDVELLAKAEKFYDAAMNRDTVRFYDAAKMSDAAKMGNDSRLRGVVKIQGPAVRVYDVLPLSVRLWPKWLRYRPLLRFLFVPFLKTYQMRVFAVQRSFDKS